MNNESENVNIDNQDMIRCEDRGCIYYIPRDLFSYLVLRTQYPRRRFVRYKEGAELYCMSVTHFKSLARDAGAISKIGGTVLVDTDIIDKFIEYYRIK